MLCLCLSFTTAASISCSCPSGGGRTVCLPEPQARTYEFDRVFSPESTQESVYACVSPLVRAAVDGFNVALLAYGQTGAGKTHTLGFDGAPQGASAGLEAEACEGMLPRACRDLFRLREERMRRHKDQGERLDVKVSAS